MTKLIGGTFLGITCRRPNSKHIGSILTGIISSLESRLAGSINARCTQYNAV